MVVVSVFSGNEALFGEWRLAKPVEAEELADALGSAVLAGRTRLLVVGRSEVRPELEPALLRLGLDHEWVTSGAAAAQACADRRFEVALVDAGMRDPAGVMDRLDLRGRRVGGPCSCSPRTSRRAASATPFRCPRRPERCWTRCLTRFPDG